MDSHPTVRSTCRLFSLLSLIVLVWTWSGHLHSPDCEINYRTVRSLAEGKGYAVPPYPSGFGTRTGLDGNEYPQYGPLQPLLAVPLFLLGKTMSGLVPPEWLSAQEQRLYRTVSFYRPSTGGGSNFEGLYPIDHKERVCRLMVSLFNPLMTWLTVLLILFFGKTLYNDELSGLILAAFYLFGTIAWPHSRPFYTESLATLCLLGSLLPAWRMGQETGCQRLVAKAGGAGAFLGLAVLARLDSVVAGPGLCLVGIASLYKVWQARGGKAAATALLSGIAGCVCLVAIHPVLNWLRFGSVLASGYSDQPEGIDFGIPFFDSLWIYLISPGKGIFGYSPPLLAGLFAWPLLYKREKSLALGSLLIGLGYLLVIGRWQNLGGWCWGPRHLFQVTPFLLLPLPLLLQRVKSPQDNPGKNLLLMLVLVLGIVVQFWGVLVDYMWPLDQTLRGLSPGEDTARVLSAGYYGPVLHAWAWRLDPDPDWFLYDLWNSGKTGARFVAGGIGSVGFALLVLFFLSLWKIYRKNRPAGIHCNS
ncbi:MAG: hypothetical protein DIKNOCCD_03230 [bacterium]|nr:hypothetical protein [bacterium]MBV6483450.1 hypothetical protein [bacterium]